MKYLKMLGLAAVAAVAVMASVGAGTASADEICTNDPCTTTITTIQATQVGSGTLHTTEGTTLVTCKGGHLEVTITKQGAGVKEIEGTINELLFTECTNTVTTLKRGTLDATRVSTTSGTLTGTGTEVTVNGIFGASCVYGAGTGLDIGTTSGANGTVLNINAVTTRVSGGFTCPSDTVWTATFEITNHNNVWWISN